VPYQAQYLAGFGAEGYQIQLDEGFGDAQAKMRRVIEGDVRRDIGGDLQRINSLQTQYGNVTFKHVLLPIWVAAYRYGGRSYRFVVNGQTGEVDGERPYSKFKIAFAILLGAILVGVFLYFAQEPPQ
jgi:hypothetical protein